MISQITAAVNHVLYHQYILIYPEAICRKAVTFCGILLALHSHIKCCAEHAANPSSKCCDHRHRHNRTSFFLNRCTVIHSESQGMPGIFYPLMRIRIAGYSSHYLANDSCNSSILLLCRKCLYQPPEARNKILILIAHLHDLITDILTDDLHLSVIPYVKCRIQLNLCKIFLNYSKTETVYRAYLGMIDKRHLTDQMFIAPVILLQHIYLLLQLPAYFLFHLGCRRIGKCNNKKFIHIHRIIALYPFSSGIKP